MNSKENAGLDEEFVGRQRQLLEDLLVRLFHARATLEDDETYWQEDPVNATPEFSSESNSMAERETDEALEDGVSGRLRNVERALEKIQDGTYGVSDLSGDVIPRGRLEVVPEAIYTAEEAQRA